MGIQRPAGLLGSFATLRQLIPAREVAERCDLCGVAVPPDHRHMTAVVDHRLLCCCDACLVLLGDTGGTYRRVPRRVRLLSDFRMTDLQWEALLIPIGVAFFFQSSTADRVVALYPSPAGATESLLSLEAWAELQQDNPILATVEPDVEALLVNRLNGARQYYRVPIDECYKLVGLIRTSWSGLSGGPKMWTSIDGFFDDLKQRSDLNGASRHA